MADVKVIGDGTTLSSSALGMLAGESIAVRDAVCVDIDAGIYKIFKCDADVGSRKTSFLGFALNAAAIGENVNVISVGQVLGFSGLTPFADQFLSGTPGAITEVFAAGTIKVAQAITSSVIFANAQENGLNFPKDLIFVRAFGSPDGTTGTRSADVEHWDFASWSTGTSGLSNSNNFNQGDARFQNCFHRVCGINSAGGGPALLHEIYDKNSWSVSTVPPEARQNGSIREFQSQLWFNQGHTSNAFASCQADGDSWNGSSWTANTTLWTGALGNRGAWNESDAELHLSGGINTASAGVTTHQSYNGSSVNSETALPSGSPCAATGDSAASDGGMHKLNGNNTDSYEWSGSAWSGVIAANRTMAFDISAPQIPFAASGSNESNNTIYMNGGTTVNATTTTNASDSFTGSSWAVETSSTLSRSGAQGSVF